MVDTGTLVHVDGFEVGGFELARATVGSPTILGSISSPAGRSGAFALRLNPASTQEQYETFGAWGTGGSESSHTQVHSLMGFAVRFSDLAPTEFIFAQPYDSNGDDLASLILEADGDLRLENEAGTGILTVNSPFTVDMWHYIEIAIHRNASGAWELWIDGNSEGSGTSDFIAGANTTDGLRLGGAGVGDGNVDFDDIYIVQHSSTLQGNNLGPSEVFGYQVGPPSSTADAGLTTNDDTLDIGDSGSIWARSAQTPITSGVWSGYAGNPANGARIFDENNSSTGHEAGPADNGGDWVGYDVTGTIQGAMWLGVYQRGTGGGTSHRLYYGNGTDTPLTFITMDTIANSADTFRAFVTDVANRVPLATESFAMGTGTTGAQNIEIREQWAFLLHTPAVGGDNFFETVLGNMPFSTGIIKRGKEILGNLPAQAGVIFKHAIAKIALGNMPFATGIINRAIGKFAVGDMPASTGVVSRGIRILGNLPTQAGIIIRATSRFAVGNMPFSTGIITTKLQALRTILGDFPAPTGVVLRGITILGDLPSQAGALIVKAGKIFLGNMPSPSGVVLRGKTLLGNVPNQTGIIIRKTGKFLVGDMPFSTGIMFRGKKLLGNMPNPTGILLRGKTLLGNMPNSTGIIVTKLGALRTLLGDMPTSTGVMLRGKIFLGNLPAQTGVVIKKFGKLLLGNMPQQTGVFTRTLLTAFRTFVGDMPNPSGVILRGKTLLGNMPNPTGALSTILNGGLILLGNMPAQVGILTTALGIKLFGNMPAQAGKVIRATTKTILGNMPNSTGIIIRKTGKVILGNMPNPSGVILRGITILGNLPQQTGTLFKGFVVVLVGNLPQQTGVIARKTAKIFVGVMPFSTGVILRGITLLGDIPAQSGAFIRGKLTAARTILGNMPQQTGELIGLAAGAAGSYLMKLRRKRTGD